MAITTFIPKVWSARLQENLHKNLVFGKLCNRSWEGEIAQYGDTVHISNLADITVKAYTPGVDIDDPEQVSGSDGATLTIDHGVYYNFFLSDVNAAQARADLMDAAMRNAAVRLAEDTEAYVLSVIRAGAGTKTSGAMPAGGVWELIVKIKTMMDTKNVPRTGRKLILPPVVEGQMLMDSHFVTGGTGLSEEALAEGMVARAAGFDIYISNDLEDELVAMTSDGVTFAQQIARMEAYRREKGFDDGVKGLSLCGAKVVVPDCVLVYNLTK